MAEVKVSEEINELEQEGVMLSWAICSWDEGKLHKFVYGQFTADEQPPNDGWVFIAEGAIGTWFDELLEEETKGIAGGVSPNEYLRMLKNTNISVDVDYLKNERLDRTDPYSLIPTKFYTVNNCPIHQLNGRYLHHGTAAGVPFFRNVRNWVLIRCIQKEIPELGIIATSSYALRAGTSMTETYHDMAAVANRDILSGNPAISDGSYHFKRRFVDIVRAGNRMITEDQTSHLFNENLKRAAIRTKANENLLMTLQGVQIDPDADNGSKNAEVNVLKTLETSGENEEKGEEGQLFSEVELETKLTLNKSINYQHGSQGYLAYGDITGKKPDSSSAGAMDFLDAEGELAREVTRCIEDREAAIVALRAEAESLQQLFLEEGMESRAGSPLSEQRHTPSSPLGRPSSALGTPFKKPRKTPQELAHNLRFLLDKMRTVRSLTVDFADAFGSWVRLIQKKREAQRKREVRRKLQEGAAHAPDKRNYCVLIAYKTSANLYGASEAVNSNTKKFSRGYEQPKSAVECKMVGVFEERDEAIKAFDKAFNEIPQEYILLSDLNAESKMIIGPRFCGKHYLIRSSGVPRERACEQCALDEVKGKSSDVIAPLYEDPASQFIINGKNYLDKLWSDTNFLDEVVLLKKAFPEEEFKFNPLLLSEESIQGLIEQIPGAGDKKKGITKEGNGVKISKSMKGNSTAADEALKTIAKKTAIKEANSIFILRNDIKETDPDDVSVDYLASLRGRAEMLKDAKRTGTRQNKAISEAKRQRKYADSPFHSKETRTRAISTRIPDDPKVHMSRTVDNSTLSSSLQNKSLRNSTFGPATSSSTVSFPTALDLSQNVMRSAAQSAPSPHQGPRFAKGSNNSGVLSGISEMQPPNTAPLLSSTFSWDIPSSAESVAGTSSPLSGRSSPMAGMSRMPSFAFYGEKTAPPRPLVYSEYEDQSLSKEALRRALHILGQSEGAGSSDLIKQALSNVRRDQDMTGSMETPTTRTAAAMSLPNSILPNTLKDTGNLVSEVPIISEIHKSCTTNVQAFFAFRGARKAIIQARRPPAFREEGLFCRTDVGEFAGFTKGRAVRAFDFQDNLKKQGKLKEEERKRIQQALRKAISIHIVDCDVPLIMDLIQQARNVRSSVLTLDIAQAESFVRLFYATCKYTLMVQAAYHGNKARRRVSAIRESLRQAHLYLLETQKQAIELASRWVPELVTETLTTFAIKQGKPIFRCTMNMSGVLYTVSLFKSVRESRHPFSLEELCSSCQTKKVERWRRTYNSEWESRRTPCTCVRIQEKEHWALELYEPLSRRVHCLRFPTDKICEVLRGVKAATHFSSPEYAWERLIGQSFDLLSPLYHRALEQRNNSFVGLLESTGSIEGSYSLALRRAAAESAVLPRLPKSLPPPIPAVVLQEENELFTPHPEPWIPAGGKAMVAKNYNSVRQDNTPVGWQWEPLVAMQQADLAIGRNIHQSNILQERIDVAHGNLDSALSEEETALREFHLAQIVYEDARSLLVRVEADITVAALRIKKVMDTEKALLLEVTALENNETEDQKQSYAPYEDGMAWKGINQHRKLKKLWDRLVLEFAPKVDLFYSSKDIFYAAKSLRIQREIEFATAEDNFWRHFPCIEESKNFAVQVRKTVRFSLVAFLSSFSTPVHVLAHENRSIPGRRRRRFRQLPLGLVFVRDPLERLRQEHRNALSVIKRRVLQLKPIQNKTLDPRIKQYVRCVALVLRDTKTGYWVIHVGQEEMPVEESTQHADLLLDKSDFSDLTSHALDNDIVLRPRDADALAADEVDFTVKYRTYNRDTYKPKAPEPFLLPSHLPRTLNGLKVHVARNDRKSKMPSSFHGRLIKKEGEELAQAEALLDRLRLQPHTGRPCLGLLHFKRRIEFTVKNFLQSKWYNDLLVQNPQFLYYDVYNGFHRHNGYTVYSTVFCILQRFEIHTALPTILSDRRPIKLSIDTAAMISSVLQKREMPLQMASFLWEIVCARFSPESLEYLRNHVDWSLPGVLQPMYRRGFCVEEPLPKPYFLTNPDKGFRGPVYSCYRFISGLYVRVRFYENQCDDLKIKLSKPKDGRFMAHRYEAETVEVLLQRHELMALVAKISAVPALVSGVKFFTMLLLHAHYRYDLFVLLLDLLHLRRTDQGLTPRTPRTPRTAQSRRRRSIKNTYIVSPLQHDPFQRILIDSSQLSEQLKTLHKKYNRWVGLRCRHLMSPLSPFQCDEMIRQLHSYEEKKPDWEIKLEKDSKNGKQMLVYSGIWSFLDLNYYFGDGLLNERTKAKTLLLESDAGASPEDIRELHPTFARSYRFQENGRFEDVHHVSILTTMVKNELILEINSDFTEFDVDDIHFKVRMAETESMNDEDVLSWQMREFLRQQEIIQQYTLVIADLRGMVKTELLPKFQRQRRAQERWKARLKTAINEYRATLQQQKFSHSRALLNQLAQRLGAAGRAKVYTGFNTLCLPSEVDEGKQEDKSGSRKKAWTVRNTRRGSKIVPYCSQNPVSHPVEKQLMKEQVKVSLGCVTAEQFIQWLQREVSVKVERMFPTQFSDVEWNVVIDSTLTTSEFPLKRFKKQRIINPYESPLWGSIGTTATIPRHIALQEYEKSLKAGVPLSSTAAVADARFRDLRSWNRGKFTSFERDKGFETVLTRDFIRKRVVQSHGRTFAVQPHARVYGDVAGSAAIALFDVCSCQEHLIRAHFGSTANYLADKVHSLVRATAEKVVSSALVEGLINRQLSLVEGIFEQELEETAEEIGEIEAKISSYDQCLSEFYKSSNQIIHSFNRVAPDDAHFSCLRSRSLSVPGVVVTDHLEDKEFPLPKLVLDCLLPLPPQETVTSNSPKEKTMYPSRHIISSKISIPLSAVFIPQDQAVPASFIDADVFNWDDCCAKYLLTKENAEDLMNVSFGSNLTSRNGVLLRDASLLGIIYHLPQSSRPKSPVVTATQRRNLRLSKLMVDYDDDFSTADNMDEKKLDWLQRLLEEYVTGGYGDAETDDVPADPFDVVEETREELEVYGDVLILLRRPQHDLQYVKAKLARLYEEYGPMRALRVKKEGREREWRISNHEKFRKKVFEQAQLLLAGAEQLYDIPSMESERNQMKTDAVPQFNVRLLLTKFRDEVRSMQWKFSQVSIVDGEPFDLAVVEQWSSAWKLLQNAFVVDPSFVINDRSLLKQFDAPCPDLFTLDMRSRHNKYFQALLKPGKRPYLEEPVEIGEEDSIYALSTSRDSSVSSEALLEEIEGDADEPESLYIQEVQEEWTGVSGASTPFQQVQMASQLFIDEVNNIVSNKRMEIHTTAGQLVYAMYQIHCHSCRKPLNCCRFPGCSHIRGLAFGELQIESTVVSPPFRSFDGEQITPIDLLIHKKAPGSGVHVVERAIRKYFLECNPSDLFPALPPVYLEDGRAGKDEKGGGLDEERYNDWLAQQEHEENLRLTFAWRDVLEEASQWRLVQRLLLRPSIKNILSSFDLLRAQGGLHHLQIEVDLENLFAELSKPPTSYLQQQVRMRRPFATLTAATSRPSDAHRSSSMPGRISSTVAAAFKNAGSLISVEASSVLRASISAVPRDPSFFTGKSALKQAGSPSVPSTARVEITSMASSVSEKQISSAASGDEFLQVDGFISESLHSQDSFLMKFADPVEPINHPYSFTVNTIIKIPMTVLKPLTEFYYRGSDDVKVDDLEGRPLLHQHTLSRAGLDPYPLSNVKAKSKLNTARGHSMKDLEKSKNMMVSTLTDIPVSATAGAMSSNMVGGIMTMPEGMYRWVMQRIRLSRRALQPEPEPERKLFSRKRAGTAKEKRRRTPSKTKKALVFELDRLQCEETVVLTDGSIVVLQVLQGILQDTSRVLEEGRGIPEVGTRFIATEELPRLDSEGITLLVFDFRSTVSRTLCLERRDLNRVAEAFGTEVDNYFLLSQRIVQHASKCVKLKRVGELCTAVMFTINSLFHGEEETHDDDDHDDPVIDKIQKDKQYFGKKLARDLGRNVKNRFSAIDELLKQHV